MKNKKIYKGFEYENVPNKYNTPYFTQGLLSFDLN